MAPKVDPENPTNRTYGGLDRAYDFFNEQLFGGQLPRCLITMQRKKGSYGYFAAERFGRRVGKAMSGEVQLVTDEIALNPSLFDTRMTDDTLSTLVHEMVHLWQHHYGEASRAGYHNREWSRRMLEVGLVPSSTGEPGGKQVGQKMTHYIAAGGAFSQACAGLRQTGFDAFYVELWDDAGRQKTKKKKAASKTKYSCPDCEVRAWAKPATSLVCGDCGVPLMEEVVVIEGDDDS
ncbi:MAG: SprT-like domain-containing protein [Proteobacteria bacterium]|nr:SprT-like domain-containing protein [Pseudomonadota bacterium]